MLVQGSRFESFPWIQSQHHHPRPKEADEKISSNKAIWSITELSSTIPYTSTDINGPASMRNLFQLGGAMKKDLPAEQ